MENNRPTRDVYADITARIVAQLEQGAAPWVRPWATLFHELGGPGSLDWERLDAVHEGAVRSVGRRYVEFLNATLRRVRGLPAPVTEEGGGR